MFCAIYPAPGGDSATWDSIINDYNSLREKYNHDRFLVLVDANVHLSYVVNHPATCRCLHCKQTPADLEIEARLASAGLFACNPPHSTHISGTTIDLILAPLEHAVEAKVVGRGVGLSDHTMLFAVLPLHVQIFDERRLGRVFWARDGWENVLVCIAGSLGSLADIILQLLGCAALRPQPLGGCVSKVQRRAI